MIPDRSDHGVAATPDWYDPGIEFRDPRYALALRVGHQAGNVSSEDWQRVEVALRDVWVVLHEGLPGNRRVRPSTTVGCRASARPALTDHYARGP
jgi:hypothetical protein